MEDLEDDTRRLWIDEILHKFGEDFGFWKYKAGLEQGRLEGFFGFNQESSTTRLYHTKEDLVNAGFEWMFSCPGFNVEEVE